MGNNFSRPVGVAIFVVVAAVFFLVGAPTICRTGMATDIDEGNPYRSVWLESI